METSIFISKIFGSIYLLLGIGMLVSKDYYQKMFRDFFDNRPVIYLTGMLIMILGWFMFESYHSFQGNWTDVFVVFSYIILFKGSFFLLFPDKLSSFKFLLDNSFLSFLVIVLGLVFCYFGFITT